MKLEINQDVLLDTGARSSIGLAEGSMTKLTLFQALLLPIFRRPTSYSWQRIFQVPVNVMEPATSSRRMANYPPRSSRSHSCASNARWTARLRPNQLRLEPVRSTSHTTPTEKGSSIQSTLFLEDWTYRSSDWCVVHLIAQTTIHC